MNIVQLLKPKALIDFVYDDCTCRQALEKMKNHGFTAIPVINKSGKYVKTLAEGDFLWFMVNNGISDMRELEHYSVDDIDIKRNVNVKPVSVTSSMDNLILLAMAQNFVPVIDDRNVFIGIVTRSDILQYCHGTILGYENKYGKQDLSDNAV